MLSNLGFEMSNFASSNTHSLFTISNSQLLSRTQLDTNNIQHYKHSTFQLKMQLFRIQIQYTPCRKKRTDKRY